MYGQAASPTRMGKEFYVFVDRLKAQIEALEKVRFHTVEPLNSTFGGQLGTSMRYVCVYFDVYINMYTCFFFNFILRCLLTPSSAAPLENLTSKTCQQLVKHVSS